MEPINPILTVLICFAAFLGGMFLITCSQHFQ